MRLELVYKTVGNVLRKSIVRGTLGLGEEGIVRIGFVHCISYLDPPISDNTMHLGNDKLIIDHLKALFSHRIFPIRLLPYNNSSEQGI